MSDPRRGRGGSRAPTPPVAKNARPSVEGQSSGDETPLAADCADACAARARTVLLAARVPAALAERVDRLAEGLSTPWHRVTRSEATRVAIERALEDMERGGEAGTAPGMRGSRRRRAGFLPRAGARRAARPRSVSRLSRAAPRNRRARHALHPPTRTVSVATTVPTGRSAGRCTSSQGRRFAPPRAS